MAKQRSRLVTDASNFSDFPLNAAIRHLATRLLKLHGASRKKITWILSGTRALCASERSVVADVIFEHSIQHHPAFESVVPRCAVPTGNCKALGAALALDHALQVREPNLLSAHISNLRAAASDAQAALRRLVKTIENGRSISEKFHDLVWQSQGEEEADLCLLPLPIAPAAQRLIDGITYMNESVLKLAMPKHQQGNHRRGLLIHMEVALAAHGWGHDEIIDALDDERGKDRPGRKDRLRQRLEEYRAKQQIATS